MSGSDQKMYLNYDSLNTSHKLTENRFMQGEQTRTQ